MLRFLVVLFFVIQVKCYDDDGDYWSSNDDGTLSKSLAFRLQPRKVFNSTNSMLRSFGSNYPSVGIEYDDRRTLFDDLARENDYSHKDSNYPNDGFGLFELFKSVYRPGSKTNNNFFVDVHKCVEGQIKKVDECNKCKCIAGQFYVCSYVTKCYDLKASKMVTSSVIASDKDHTCVEGEDIPSMQKCNKCKCINGQVLCTLPDCSTDDLPVCNNKDLIKLPDSCNYCDCYNGVIYCTTKICLDIPKDTSTNIYEIYDVEVFKEYEPKLNMDKNINACTPGTWYGIRNKENQYCKECLCINGEMGFCFLNFCKNSGECIRNEKFSIATKDTCYTCQCTENESWECYTSSGSCTHYYHKPECTVGVTTRNPLTACGACYCVSVGQSVCATDEKCAGKY